VSVSTSWPVRRSQILAVVSSPAVASSLPSGLNATPSTRPLWATKERRSRTCLDATSQTCTDPSALPTARRFPAVSKAALCVWLPRVAITSPVAAERSLRAPSDFVTSAPRLPSGLVAETWGE
jgi:hypothetical protein